MSEPKWTPGPWKAFLMNMPRSWDYWEIGPIRPDAPVAEIDNTGLGEETDKANAHLIAAAPELYREHWDDDQLLMQMATVILNDQLAGHIPFGLREKVEARLRNGTPALAKARGEKP